MEGSQQVYFFMCEVRHTDHRVPVYVDKDTYHKYKHLKWTVKARVETFEAPSTVLRWERGYPVVVMLHKLVMQDTGVCKGANIHHTNGTLDCRRANLRVYQTYEEHQRAEHPESIADHSLSKGQRKRRRWMNKILCNADLHPHCG